MQLATLLRYVWFLKPIFADSWTVISAAQVVWRSTTQVACAMVGCNSGVTDERGAVILGPASKYTVCRYSPPGNIQGQFPYVLKFISENLWSTVNHLFQTKCGKAGAYEMKGRASEASDTQLRRSDSTSSWVARSILKSLKSIIIRIEYIFSFKSLCFLQRVVLQ